MSCITEILKLKGTQEILHVHDGLVIEGGGEYRGLEYLITFTEYGTRCGYVALQEGMTCDIDEISAHGGITFEGEDHRVKHLLTIPCNDKWIGFDAAHWGDERDLELAKKYFSVDEKSLKRMELFEEIHKNVHEMERLDPNFSHKSYEYMEKECHHIIDQLLDEAA